MDGKPELSDWVIDAMHLALIVLPRHLPMARRPWWSMTASKDVH